MISQPEFLVSDFVCPCPRCHPLRPDLVTASSQLIEWANKVRMAMNACGIAAKITSGVRCVAHNKEVGGSPLSMHLCGEACDIACDSSGAYAAVKTLCTEVPCKFIEVAPHHVHFDTRSAADANVERKLITGTG